MTRFLAVLAVLLLSPAGGATAMKTQFSTAELCAILQPCLPPPQYSSGPFLEKPVIEAVTLRQVQSICGRGYAAFLGKRVPLGPASVQAVKAAGGNFGNSIMGCAQLTGTSCIVHVPEDLKAEIPELYKLVVAHELGHCRGWVHARY